MIIVVHYYCLGIHVSGLTLLVLRVPAWHNGTRSHTVCDALASKRFLSFTPWAVGLRSSENLYPPNPKLPAMQDHPKLNSLAV